MARRRAALAGKVGWSRSATGDGGPSATVFGDVLVVLSAMLVSIGYVAGARLGQGGYRRLAATYWA